MAVIVCRRDTEEKQHPISSEITVYSLGWSTSPYALFEQRLPKFPGYRKKEFDKFHACLDNTFRQLRTDGFGSSSKHAEVFSKEEEALLWDKEVLGIGSPKQLLRAVFYLNGRNFCLRGGEEHRQLKLSQLQRCTDPDRFVYTEHASKNRSGGLRQLRVENKVVPVYADPQAGIKCHVAVLDLYLSKLPAASASKDVFYLQPLPKVPSDDSKPWYALAPVGRNTLSTMVKNICTDARVGGNKTNHSLRATGTTALFTAGVPEKVIQQRSGHLLLQGLRQYEKVSSEQQQAACRVLSSCENTTFSEEMEKPTTSDLEPASVSSPLPGMHFSGCTVNIYQGKN